MSIASDILKKKSIGARSGETIVVSELVQNSLVVRCINSESNIAVINNTNIILKYLCGQTPCCDTVI